MATGSMPPMTGLTGQDVVSVDTAHTAGDFETIFNNAFGQNRLLPYERRYVSQYWQPEVKLKSHFHSSQPVEEGCCAFMTGADAKATALAHKQASPPGGSPVRPARQRRPSWVHTRRLYFATDAPGMLYGTRVGGAGTGL